MSGVAQFQGAATCGPKVHVAQVRSCRQETDPDEYSDRRHRDEPGLDPLPARNCGRCAHRETVTALLPHLIHKILRLPQAAVRPPDNLAVLVDQKGRERVLQRLPSNSAMMPNWVRRSLMAPSGPVRKEKFEVSIPRASA